jgi:hypothetical protein
MSERDARGPTAVASGRLEAVLFDVDGVVTDTAQAHAAAWWRRLFDEFLRARAEARHEDFRPFDAERDYREFVDGKPRHDGIRSFLGSRGIDLPEGTPDDPPDAATVFGLGRRKQQYFRSWLEDRKCGRDRPRRATRVPARRRRNRSYGGPGGILPHAADRRGSRSRGRRRSGIAAASPQHRFAIEPVRCRTTILRTPAVHR